MKRKHSLADIKKSLFLPINLTKPIKGPSVCASLQDKSQAKHFRKSSYLNNSKKVTIFKSEGRKSITFFSKQHGNSEKRSPSKSTGSFKKFRIVNRKKSCSGKRFSIASILKDHKSRADSDIAAEAHLMSPMIHKRQYRRSRFLTMKGVSIQKRGISRMKTIHSRTTAIEKVDLPVQSKTPAVGPNKLRNLFPVELSISDEDESEGSETDFFEKTRDQDVFTVKNYCDFMDKKTMEN